MALPKKNRLTSKKDIDHVFKRGRTVKGSFLFIKRLDNPKGYSRFAFVVSSKYVSLAVDRNRIKRMFSEKVRRTPALLEHGYDMVVVIHKKVEREQFKELGEELREILFKLT
ncbi:MAG: ribonuclease P protein component [Candidatus Yanofskybacteria bacterium]|nr:ribonuclease P protein component [Candidatus Yanofskybacteria bacterium]